MTHVTVTAERVSVIGHSNYSTPGTDIVCSAVSVLAQTLVQSAFELCEDKTSWSIKEGEVILEYKHPSERLRLLIGAFIIGVGGIAEAYPEHVELRVGVELVKSYGVERAWNS